MNPHPPPSVLSKPEDNLQLFIDAVLDYAIFALDPDGRVMTWNKGAQRLKGYSAQEIIGQHFSIFYTAEDRARRHPQHELKRAALEGKYEEEGWRVRKDGTHFWANVMITAVFDQGKLIGFSKVTRDLTERKRSEDLLEKRVEQRTRELTEAKGDAERLAMRLQVALNSRDEFLSVASHELKTPLTSLKLQAQMRKRILNKPNFKGFSIDELTKMTNDDERQVERLNRLVDDMLDISRISSGKLSLSLEMVDLALLIRETLERFALQLETIGCVVEFQGPPTLVGEWDPYRIEQVFINLLTNAMKYGDGKPILIVAEARGDRVRFSVKDNGMGISKKDQERIFYQFERAVSSSEIGGLGLGLFIADQIVKIHQGKITVKSELGEGATFEVELPLHSQSGF
jgi:PAS domain S-box-containing protein